MFYDEPDRSYKPEMNTNSLVQKENGPVQDVLNSIKDWMYVLGVSIGLILWFARLEWRGRQNKSDLERETADRIQTLADLEKRISNQRHEDHQQNERDWNRMYQAIETVQKDIKELLQRLV